MDIIILSTTYPNIYNDNSSIFVQDQVRALAKYEGVNVSVVAAIPISLKDIWKNKLLSFGLFEYSTHKYKVKIFLFPAIPKLKRFNNFIRFLVNKHLLKKSLQKGVDLIHVHNSVAGKAALWCKNRFNIPYCVTEHSSVFARGFIKQYEVTLYKTIYKNSSCNIAVSKEFSQLLSKIFDLDFEYIPNIVDTGFFTPSKKRQDNIFQFINIANLTKNKNQVTLINAFVQAFRDNENVNLSILGGGPEYHILKQIIEKAHRGDQITLYGYATRSEVRNRLIDSNAFVLSSKYETFGVVTIEAMSCGLPVISTKSGGPESIITNEHLGLLVENNNVEALSNAMLSVYNSKYDSQYIRNYCIENFSEEAVVYKLNKVYEKILL